MSNQLVCIIIRGFRFQHKSGYSEDDGPSENVTLSFLTFLYKIDIEKYSKMFINKNIKLPLAGIELTTLVINRLEGKCLLHSATQTSMGWKILKQFHALFHAPLHSLDLVHKNLLITICFRNTRFMSTNQYSVTHEDLKV